MWVVTDVFLNLKSCSYIQYAIGTWVTQNR